MTSRTADRLGPRFFRLTALNILSNLTVPLVGLVDTAMLGHLPELKFLAGVALASILFDFLFWTFGFLRMGSTGSTAVAIGRGEVHESFLILYRFLLLAMAIGLTILAFQWPLRELGFALLSGAPEVEAAGRTYFDARVWGAPAAMCNYAFLGWFLGREESGHVLLITAIGNVCNVVLNYVFIIQLGLAAMGAGISTAISQYLMLAIAIFLFFTRTQTMPWIWSRVRDLAAIVPLLRLNFDIMLRTFCLISAFGLFLNFSAKLGTQTLAVNTILDRVLLSSAYLIDGVAYATESLAGVLYGQANRKALARLLRLAIASGLFFAAVCLFVVLVAPTHVLGLLTSHESVTTEAARMAWWLVPTLAFGALAYVFDGYFLGLTRSRVLRNSMFFSLFVGFVPLGLYATYQQSNTLLWAALVTFMIARAGTLGLAARYSLPD